MANRSEGFIGRDPVSLSFGSQAPLHELALRGTGVSVPYDGRFDEAGDGLSSSEQRFDSFAEGGRRE